jgi:hypothetical protein
MFEKDPFMTTLRGMLLEDLPGLLETLSLQIWTCDCLQISMNSEALASGVVGMDFKADEACPRCRGIGVYCADIGQEESDMVTHAERIDETDTDE